MSSELPEHPKGALRSGNIADELARGPRHLHVVVVSPAQPIFEGDVRWVTVSAWDGQLGIWPGHAAIVAALGSGLLRIGQDGGLVARFAVRGGFLKVGEGKVTILVDSAVAEADVDTAEARRELDETVGALRPPSLERVTAEAGRIVGQSARLLCFKLRGYLRARMHQKLRNPQL